MKIVKLGKEHIEEYRNLVYLAYPTLRDLSEDGISNYDMELDLLIEEGSGVTSFGAFIENKLVAVMKSIDFLMNVHGKMSPVSGLGTLAVHPLYKKKGIGAEMTAYFENYAKERGIDTTLLQPFRPDYYGKFGYGYSTKMDLYQIDLKYCPEFDSPYIVKFINSPEELFLCHEELVKLTHGMIGYTLLEKKDIRENFQDLGTHYLGVYDNDKLIGYVSYGFDLFVHGNYTKNYIKANDIFVKDSDSLKTLFNYFRQQGDQAEYIEFYTQIQDIEHFFSNPLDRSFTYVANGYVQSNRQASGLMIKILDPTLWIERHGESINMPSEITWDIDGEKAGSGRYIVTISRNYLSSLWYGAVSFMSLYKLGLVQCNEEAVPLLRKTFPGDNPPQNNTDF